MLCPLSTRTKQPTGRAEHSLPRSPLPHRPEHRHEAPTVCMALPQITEWKQTGAPKCSLCGDIIKPWNFTSFLDSTGPNPFLFLFSGRWAHQGNPGFWPHFEQGLVARWPPPEQAVWDWSQGKGNPTLQTQETCLPSICRMTPPEHRPLSFLEPTSTQSFLGGHTSGKSHVLAVWLQGPLTAPVN